MIYYSKPGITEGIDLTKSKDSKECIVCHYWYFNHGFKFQKSVFNGCHDLLMMSPILIMLLLPILEVLIFIVLFMVLAIPLQFIC